MDLCKLLELELEEPLEVILTNPLTLQMRTLRPREIE